MAIITGSIGKTAAEMGLVTVFLTGLHLSSLTASARRLIIRPVKVIFAYTLLAIGIPVTLGAVLGLIFTIPFTGLLSGLIKPSSENLHYIKSINGVVASISGALLFRIFGIMAGVEVPIIMSIWITIYWFLNYEPKQSLIGWISGIFVGWFTIGKMVLAA